MIDRVVVPILLVLAVLAFVGIERMTSVEPVDPALLRSQMEHLTSHP